MLNKILLIVLFLFALNHKNKIYEGTINSNSGKICKQGDEEGFYSFLFDRRCGSGHKYEIIKNCIGPQDNFSIDGDCSLCDSGNKGKCKATYKGGYCKKGNNITDARGVKINNPGRDISDMDEEELRNYNENKYQDLINECDPFKTKRSDDYEDDEDDVDEEDNDDLDNLYRDRNRRSHRRKQYRSEHSQESLNNSKTLIYSIGIILFIIAIFGYLIKTGKIDLNKIKNKLMGTNQKDV